MPLWRTALDSFDSSRWEIYCPPSLASYFEGLDCEVLSDLELLVPLRSRQAEQLAVWVGATVVGEIANAESVADSLRRADFPVYVTRELEAAKQYAAERYGGEPDARYGLVATSHAKNLEALGVDNSWIATSRMNIAKWFNAPPSDPKSCCALTQPVTEFGCQGLELDLPIVCWGDDMIWSGDAWDLRPKPRRYPIDEPKELLRNAYRVLLTRGRDGLIIWVPPDPSLDQTADVLTLAGAARDFERI